jgi:prepilin peptidase CpaA
MALTLASCLFLAAMIHAAVSDLRRHRVLNWTILALIFGYVPLALAAGLGWMTVLSSLAAATLVFVIGFAGFCAGWLGGGDVKLATAATLWIGAALVVPFLLLTALFGAVVTLLLIVLHRWQTGMRPELTEVPYSPGMVLAALALFGSSQWFAAP